GKVINVPEPTMVLMVPAATPARQTATASQTATRYTSVHQCSMHRSCRRAPEPIAPGPGKRCPRPSGHGVVVGRPGVARPTAISVDARLLEGGRRRGLGALATASGAGCSAAAEV